MKRSRAPRWRSGAIWFIAMLLLVAIGPSLATAQGKDPVAQKLAVIRDRMEKGQALFVVANFAAAAKIFDAGYREHPYSAFLFNSGVCYQKLKDVDKALERFREYVRIDPQAPDVERVKERIAALEAALAAALPATPDAGVEEAGAATDAQAPPMVVVPEDRSSMKSLVVIETEPDQAPLRLYERVQDGARPFAYGKDNPGWKEVTTGSSPLSLTLDVGRYHVVVEKFRDFNVSEADLDVSPGHVHHFKANLSQGAFMAFLRVAANVEGASVYIDDKQKKRPSWGVTPHGELVPAGSHELLVEAPGFESLVTRAVLKQGEQKEMEVKLVRVGYGFLRVDSNAPEIKVNVDGAPVGFWRSGEPPLDVKLSAGKHRITVSSAGRKEYEGTVDVPRGQILPVRAHMIPKYPRGAAWTQAAIGAVFIGAAIYLGLESNRLHDELNADREKGVVEQEDERFSRGRWFAVGANAGFVIGGVLGVLATYNFLKDPLPDSASESKKPVEFDDPRKQRPLASLSPRTVAELARRARERRQSAKAALRVAPVAGVGVGANPNGAGLLIGGSF